MTAAKTEDITLWQKLCDGNVAAFEQIMNGYYRQLFRYGIRILPDEEIVRDCLQDVFIDIWIRRPALQSVNSVNFYLIKAVRNRLLLARRKDRSVAFPDNWTEKAAFISEITIESELILEEEQRLHATKLETLLNSLPPRQKEIIHLKFFEELSSDEIAEIMSLNRQSVYNLLHETLRKLRSLWLVTLSLFTI